MEKYKHGYNAWIHGEWRNFAPLFPHRRGAKIDVNCVIPKYFPASLLRVFWGISCRSGGNPPGAAPRFAMPGWESRGELPWLATTVGHASLVAAENWIVEIL
jgi:hypothetical protein